MLNQTAEVAIKAMIRLALAEQVAPLSPKVLAAEIGCSPTYLAKVLGGLARTGLLRSYRGANGGFSLERRPERINLLEIVEASQGLLVADYCAAIGDARGPVCGFHQAMWEVYMATRQALEAWTLDRLAASPLPTGPLAGNAQCRMAFLHECESDCTTM